MRACYEFGMLGPLEVRRDGLPVVIGAPKLRFLLATLLADANHVVPAETLMGRLWGEEPPGGARSTLQNYVLRLRRVLGPDVVLTRPRGYLIEVAPDDVLDLHRFGDLVRRGRAALNAGAPGLAAAELREALALWRGEPLSDLPSELPSGHLQDLLPALTEQRLDALELRIEADLALGRTAEVLPELRGLIGAHPLRERFWAQRMLALHRCGRQGEALECYRTVAALLAEELGADPGTELKALHLRLLTAAPELDAGEERHTDPRPAGCTGILPAETTSFVGRENELAEAEALLRGSRLVTLTGVGGVGKTRLALRLAAVAGTGFADGVWLADLAPLTDPVLLGRAVAEALDLRDQSARPPADAVADHLRNRHLLLVLDNCEHLLEPVAELTLRLLRSAPGLRVLATSRERLGVPGEHVLLVPSLTLPDVSGAPATGDTRADGPGATHAEAVRLLVDRATACVPAFRVTERNREALAQLCLRLDGIPLAIELAAVRLASITAEEILARLDDRFRLFSVPLTRTTSRYQQTLRGVVGWSYDLCTEPERLLWARLSAFSGSFDLEAAEAVCAGEHIASEEVLDLLAGLVRKSIVMVNSTENKARYRVLETIRQYGLQRLDDRSTELHLRHSDYYHDLTVRAAAEWCGTGEVDWLSRLRRDLPNLRAALDFCATHPGRGGMGLEIAVNLTRTRCWFFNSTLGEGRHWLERLHARTGLLPTEVNTMVAAMKAWIALCQGDRAAVRDFMAETRATADSVPVAASVYIEGAHAMLVRGDPGSITQLACARDGFRATGHVGDAHMATMLWAMAAAFLGSRDTAFRARDEYTAEAESSGAYWARTWAQWCAALTELRHGEPARALAPMREALARQRDINDSWGPVWGLETLAWTVAVTGHHHRAARLLGAAHRLREVTGVALIGLQPFHAVHTETEHRLRSSLGLEEYDAAWKRGTAAEDSIGLALSLTDEVLRAI